jgi:hypothetical protein
MDIFAKKVFRLFEPFHVRLPSKFRKNAGIQNFFAEKTLWVSKNEEFYADFESAGEVLKSFIRKKLFTKMCRKYALFSHVCHICFANNFLYAFFLTFHQI